MEKAKLGSYGVFGSTSRRFSKPKNTNPNLGPGTYNPQPMDKYKIRKRDPRDAVFQSRTKRAQHIPDKQVPPPGAYNIESPWEKKSSSPSGTSVRFLSTSPRFKEGLWELFKSLI